MQFYCPGCAYTFGLDEGPDGRCPRCGQQIDGNRFYASGADAMGAQVRIVSNSNKMATIRIVSSYAVSVIFAIIGALLIVFAPESRTMAANIVAAALLITATGIAGFTRFKATVAGVKIDADKPGSN